MKKYFFTLKTNVLIIIIFCMLSFSCVYIPFHTGYIYSGSDVRFHINRIVELSKSSGYPLVNFFSFNRTGYDINTFYPILTIYPFIILFKLIKNKIVSYYIFIGILLVITQVSAYFAARGLKENKYSAIAFAIIYTFSGYMMFIYWFAFELGEALAFIALPILMVSTIAFIYPKYVNSFFFYKKEFLLILSLLWITYSHLLTTVICLIVLILVFIGYLLKNLNVNIFKNLLKMLVYYILCSSFFWFNFLNAYFNSKIDGPNKYLAIVSPSNLVTNSINNNLVPGNKVGFGINNPADIVGLGIIVIISYFILMIDYRKLSRLVKVFTILSSICLVISTSLFCWKIMYKLIPSIDIIQSTFRFLIFAVLFISFGISLYININKIYTALLIILVLIFNVEQLTSFTETGKSQEEFNYVETIHHRPNYAAFKVNNGEFGNLYKGFYNPVGGPADYLSKEQIGRFKDVSLHHIRSGRNSIKHSEVFYTNKAKYSFYINHYSHNVEMPVYKTNNRYCIKDNGKPCNYKISKHGTIELQKIKRGHHNILIEVKPNNLFLISLVTTIVGILLIICTYLKIRLNVNRY